MGSGGMGKKPSRKGWESAYIGIKMHMFFKALIRPSRRKKTRSSVEWLRLGYTERFMAPLQRPRTSAQM